VSDNLTALVALLAVVILYGWVIWLISR